jgi:hypothetical protein
MTKIEPQLRAQIAQATEALTIAQQEVEKAMLQLVAGVPRAQKSMVTEALRNAFEKVANTREALQSLLDEGTR